MANDKVVEIKRDEVRTLTYSCNAVSLTFDVNVSSSEMALAEIADFIQCLHGAIADLEALRRGIATPAKAKVEAEAEEGSEHVPASGSGHSTT